MAQAWHLKQTKVTSTVVTDVITDLTEPALEFKRCAVSGAILIGTKPSALGQLKAALQVASEANPTTLSRSG